MFEDFGMIYRMFLIKKNKGERWRLWKIRKYWIWGSCEGNNDKYVDKYQTVHFRNKVPLSSLADQP